MASAPSGNKPGSNGGNGMGTNCTKGCKSGKILGSLWMFFGVDMKET